MSLKKDNMESNAAIKREINQGGSGKLKISEPPRKKLGDEIVLPTREINPMEKNIMEHKKMQELQNKIMGQGNNIALAKEVVPDPRKRQFIKKGILGIVAGVGIAVFSKMTRGIQNINFNDDTTAIDLQTAGNVSMPSQPAVAAHNSSTDADKTGNGATATVDFDTEIFDQNADFASDTFTAPVTGRYRVSAQVFLDQLTTASTLISINIVASNRTWNKDVNGGLPDGVGGGVVISIAALIDMDAADTFTITVRVTGESSDLVDIAGPSGADIRTFVTAELVA